VKVCSGAVYVHIGNLDIIDLIHDSVYQSSASGLVGAKEEMPCQSGGLHEWVEWGIYHDQRDRMSCRCIGG